MASSLSSLVAFPFTLTDRAYRLISIQSEAELLKSKPVSMDLDWCDVGLPCKHQETRGGRWYYRDMKPEESFYDSKYGNPCACLLKKPEVLEGEGGTRFIKKIDLSLVNTKCIFYRPKYCILIRSSQFNCHILPA